MIYRIAVVQWCKDDGISEAICRQFARFGHDPVPFFYFEALPQNVDFVLTFAPYDRFIQIPQQLAKIPPEKRPIFIHWDTEANLNPKLPWEIWYLSGYFRSWLGRHEGANFILSQGIANRMRRLQFFGDYIYAMSNGWIDILAEYSEYYTQKYQKHKYPVKYVPWGTIPEWYANLNLDRDIDVLWMGELRTKRRKTLFHRIRNELNQHNLKIYVADNDENPFIFGDVRTSILNRSKITLNLLPQSFICNFPHRFHIAAPNRSLVVSEPLFPHNSQYIAGVHYVAAPAEQIVDTILYYLEHEEERKQIVDNAYALTVEEWTFQRSISMILDCFNEAKLKKRIDI
jgi:glycosyltransferase involved in cell wall biosynthesis